MSLWSWLFGRRQPVREPATFPGARPAPEAGTLYAPGTRIAYDSHLIEQLQADHRRLLTLFTHIRSTFRAGDLAHASASLEQFKSSIQEHLLVEEIRLYVYLQYTLSSDDLNRTLMRNMHREMASIGHDVLGFLGKYSALNETPALHKSFAADLDQLGEVLIGRIKREETSLYPLYVPPGDLSNAYADEPAEDIEQALKRYTPTN